jgi:CheY-like chemotaxis protein
MSSTTDRPLSGARILIVEDTTELGLQLIHIFQRRGGAAHCDLVASVDEAQELLYSLPPNQIPDIVVIDYNLIGANGGYLAVWMREHCLPGSQPDLHEALRISYSNTAPHTIQARIAELLQRRELPPDPPAFHAIITKSDQTIDELVRLLGALLTQARAAA